MNRTHPLAAATIVLLACSLPASASILENEILSGPCDSSADHAIRADTLWMRPNNSRILPWVPYCRGFNAPLIGMWDFGQPKTNHREFGTRLTIGTEMPVTGTTARTSDHATAVAGIIIGGGQTLAAIGSAPSARLRAFDEFNRDLEMVRESGTGMRISNHSYGPLIGWERDRNNFRGTGKQWIFWGNEQVFGSYTAGAQRRDEIMHNFPAHLMVFASGNDGGADSAGPAAGASYARFDHMQGSTQVFVEDRQFHPADGWHTDQAGQRDGYGTVADFCTAKNVLTVGNCEDLPAYAGPGSVILALDSSVGPCRDGRIKPDVVANGVNLTVPTMATTSSYSTTFSGTSASAPTVTGGVALLMELANLKFPDVVLSNRRFPNLARPSLASTFKALVIHTADEAGEAAGPDYKFGWGLVNIERAGQLIETDAAGAAHTIQEITLNQGQTFSMDVATTFQPLPAGSPPLSVEWGRRVTMVWTDPPAAVPSPGFGTAILINDLDVTVTPLNDPTHPSLPWNLSRTSPASPAFRGSNSVDNVERIDFISPPTTQYRITVSHKGTLAGGSQKFSLITTGFARIAP